MGPLERKTPLDGGKVEFNFMFLLCVWGGEGNDKCICCRRMNMQQNSGCDFIYAHKGEHFNFIYSKGRNPSVLKIWCSGNCTEAPSSDLFSLTCNFLK